ncbi:MAG: DUF2855 family protein [Pseudomonadota bacterium]
MTSAQRLEVQRNALATTRIREHAIGEPAAGEIVVAIDRFALTANNITYGVAGDKIGYWQFFPSDGDWGVIPVWGFADVIASAHDEITVGERLYGYWPMGTHLVMQPGRISDTRCFDVSAHRAELPPVYNAYSRCNAEAHYDPAMDDARMLLLPLYATSYCLYDFLVDNEFFGASQVIVPSASSKTAIGLAYALDSDDSDKHVVGMTSAGNLEKVIALGLYDQVITYDELAAIDATSPSVIIDMSGNGDVLAALHRHLADNMKFTSNVGITHYEHNTMGDGFIRDRSRMFFAPGHMQKRAKDWGPGEFEKRSFAFWYDAAKRSDAWLSYRHIDGAEAMAQCYQDVLAGSTDPNQGLIIRPGAAS